MDRRKQYGLAGAFVSLGLCLLSPANAQDPSPSPSPTATPWPSPTKPAPTHPPETPKAASPAPAPVADDVAAARRADRKARREEIEQFLDGRGGEAPVNKLLDRLPPGADREAFRKNLMRWRDLSPEERDALRGQADNRGELIKAEIDKTIRDSGLRLTPDQREVYALRYMQERRKLEKALRDQMGSERARRLPGIVEQLKKEFATPAPPPSQTAAPTPPVSN